MNRNPTLRRLILPLFVVILGIGNYARLPGTEAIRTIHVVTLLAIGAGLGVLLVNTIRYFRNDA